jgi:hypothetical protein
MMTLSRESFMYYTMMMLATCQESFIIYYTLMFTSTPMIFHGYNKSQGLLLQVVNEKNSGMDTNSGLEIQVL